MQVAVNVENLSVKFGNTTILEEITFQIMEGDYVAILGPNGAGKSTLLKALLGLVKPTQGKASFFGEPIQNIKAKKIVGYVPQQTSAQESAFPATVEEVVRCGRTAALGLFHPFGAKDQKLVDEAMAETEVLDLKNQRLCNLSGGQKQRVLIARALASQPRLLILDEPTAGVDLAQQERFYQLLAKLNKENNLTLIFVSHDVDIMAQHANRFLCLNKKLICHTSPDNFIKEEYISELYGDNVTSITHHHH